jgi:SAM-dependent methyltransferase
MTDNREIDLIHERYGRRTRRYEPGDRWIYMSRQELERAIIEALRDAGMLPAGERRLLDIGCGAGSNILQFLRLGFRPEQIVGSELQPARVEAARAILPQSTRVIEGDASLLNLPGNSFDIVFQSLVFSSILDDGLQERLARKMRDLVAPDGGILWYDFVWDNPSNPDVRGVSLARVRELFPTARVRCRRVTLAPPISRRVAGMHPRLYDLCNVIAPLRTHVLCWIDRFDDR